MRSVPAAYVRDHWAEIVDDAVREPIMVTSRGRPRVFIANAGLAAQLDPTASVDMAAASRAIGRPVTPPKYPWLDRPLSREERLVALERRQTQIYHVPFDEWNDEEWKILDVKPSDLLFDD
ncbi:MAG: type II toxin-antitoxin system Phd/YefM family antitoxin [Microbacteriaceae bacterium]|nr:type II toxin-antitoxin system Phd/YefM family antitoxin [Microbacteriaceae bacterium]MCL2793972.1 type II toxin-antitoxin system Phd/YefM family antitoxin [Microbacteriaceae bacterium]